MQDMGVNWPSYLTGDNVTYEEVVEDPKGGSSDDFIGSYKSSSCYVSHKQTNNSPKTL